MNKLLYILVGTILFLPGLASAAGIQVSPSSLDLKGPADKAITATLVVANPTPDVQLFNISADNFDTLIAANPASFTLEAGARKTVTITIKPHGDTAINTEISVVSRPLVATALSANTGVKIPLNVVAGPAEVWLRYVWVGGALLALIVAGLIYKFLGRKKTI